MRSVSALHLGISSALALVLVAGLRPVSAQIPPAPAESPSVPVLFDRFCGDCHLGVAAERDFDLQRLFGKGVAPESANLDELALAVQRLRSHTMPPVDEPQPSLAERRELVQALAQLAPGKPGDRIATVRRLTRRQYEHTVRDLFGIEWQAKDLLPEDSPAHGFDGQGDVQNMSPLLFEKYHEAAGEVAAAVLRDATARRAIFAEDASWASVLPPLLARAFRRPVVADEVQERTRDIETMLANGQSREQVQHAMLCSVLLSPSFLLRVEFGRDDAPAELSPHELAVRLSYMLTTSMPDDELRALADAGSLVDPDVLVAQAQRLAKSEQGMRLAKDFAAQWLGMRDVLTMTADFRRYGQIWNQQLRPSFLQEGLHFFAAIVAEDRSVLELLDCDTTFVNPVLAKHYGLPKVAEGFHRVPLNDGRRGGVLGMGVMLMTSSFPLRTSPVKRGKWILDKLLDSPPPPPPANVGSLPADDTPKRNLTMRQQLEQHRQRRSCASCHAQMDALGFALENYDVVGLWRDELHGVAVDSRATLPDGTELLGPIELKQALLARSQDFVRALAKNLLVYAVGREMGLADEVEIAKIVASTRQHGDRFSALLAAVVQSPLFTLRDPGAAQ